MNRLLNFTALALLIGLVPALAAENPSPPSPGSNTGAPSVLPTQPGATPEASKSATVPPSGKVDTSGGATEQSSSPPSAGSTMGKMGAQSSPSGGQATPNPTAPSAND
jgi:hypothetical protein